MKILIKNCSPVRNGATAEIVNLVKDNVSEGNEVRSICIDDYDVYILAKLQYILSHDKIAIGFLIAFVL